MSPYFVGISVSMYAVGQLCLLVLKVMALCRRHPVGPEAQFPLSPVAGPRGVSLCGQHVPPVVTGRWPPQSDGWAGLACSAAGCASWLRLLWARWYAWLAPISLGQELLQRVLVPREAAHLVCQIGSCFGGARVRVGRWRGWVHREHHGRARGAGEVAGDGQNWLAQRLARRLEEGKRKGSRQHCCFGENATPPAHAIK